MMIQYVCNWLIAITALIAALEIILSFFLTVFGLIQATGDENKTGKLQNNRQKIIFPAIKLN